MIVLLLVAILAAILAPNALIAAAKVAVSLVMVGGFMFLLLMLSQIG